MKKIISIFCLSLALALIFCSAVSAETSTSFSHINEPDGTQSTVLSRELYNTEYYITAAKLGLKESLTGLSDICFGPSGEIYALCDTGSRLIRIKPDYTLDREYTVTDKNGEKLSFDGAKGIFVDENGLIYISDTGNERVIITDNSGRVTEIRKSPDSDLIPADFVFQPTAVARDEQGFLYILSQGCYYGALTYSPSGEFKGFYGANSVETTVLDTMQFIWEKLTGNDAKKSATVKKLPYSFTDFALDKDGYMLVCTGTTDGVTNGKGQIRKISPGGTDILYTDTKNGKSSLSTTVNFVENTVVKRKITPCPQNFISLAVDESGFIYALDSTLGVIYVYDEGCNLLGAFGGGFGAGNQAGIFKAANSVAVSGDKLLIADSGNESITVFSISEYGRLLKSAQSLYLKGQYKDAEQYWNRVLALDGGNQAAYRGLAMSKYYDGEYNSALKYAEKGLDYTVYDLAYQTLLKQFIKANFAYIAGGAVLILAAAVAAVILVKKKKRVIIKNPLLSTAAGAVFHPFNSFNDVKYKNRGSLKIATALLFAFFLFSMLGDVAGGFLFSSYSPKSYNVFYTVAKTVLLVLLWSVANWLVGALFSGKAALKEIYIATAYSLIPLIVYKVLSLVLSYILPLSGATFINGLYTAVLIYTFFILSVAVMTVQEYGFFKFLGTGALTLFGMLLVIFILFMVIVQIQQLGIFISSVFMEVVYR